MGRKTSPLKIAIIHDWLVTDAGAEKVLKEIIEIYPNADIFSIVDFLSDKDRDTVLGGRKAKTSFIQKLPFAKEKFRHYFPLFPKAVESFDLSKYDLIISSSWAFAKGVKTRKDQLHICYCYTPIRYAWDLYEEYTQDLPFLRQLIVKTTLKYVRYWDIKTLGRVSYFIADSKFVAKRIEKTYKKNSKVIYPPVDTNNFKLNKEKKDFYLTASRLVPYKKTKLIVESFNRMPDKKLIVIGEGEEYDTIKKIAKENIIVLGYVEKEEMIEYMQKAKAFVYAAIEDFGIVPIEAMSCGTPVIALKQGATVETVCKYCGVHFPRQNTEDIIKSVEYFEGLEFNYEDISNYSKKYSTERFKNELQKFINAKIDDKEVIKSN
jgi:glycosyltransferase involved in cell wall biosynthesis